MDAAGFARECDRNATALRALPRDLAARLARDVPRRVAEPLAAAVRRSGRGVYGARIAATATVTTGSPPAVTVGGPRRVVSGGATAGQLVWGNELGWNGRRTSRQFIRNSSPFIIATVEGQVDDAMDAWVEITDAAVEDTVR
jgi:hypothetical protein